MGRVRYYVVVVLGSAALAAVFGLLNAGPAIAQAVRAALVKNVDEPGRNPYQGFVAFNGSVAAAPDGSYFCQQPPSAPTCFLIFPFVPAGKRLVVESLTGTVRVQSPAFPSAVTLQASDPSFRNVVSVPSELLLGHDFGGGAFQYGANAVFKAYVEPGGDVRVTVAATGAPGALQGGSVALGGYLVDVP